MANRFEARLCAWCGAPCFGRDETGAPACRNDCSEDAALAACSRKARPPQPATDTHGWRERDVRDFIRGEFRGYGGIV